MPRIIFKTYLSSGVTGVCRSSKGSAFLRPVPSGPHLGRYRPETLQEQIQFRRAFKILKTHDCYPEARVTGSWIYSILKSICETIRVKAEFSRTAPAQKGARPFLEESQRGTSPLGRIRWSPCVGSKLQVRYKTN